MSHLIVGFLLAIGALVILGSGVTFAEALRLLGGLR